MPATPWASGGASASWRCPSWRGPPGLHEAAHAVEREVQLRLRCDPLRVRVAGARGDAKAT
eukprot:13450491-Alexandrium_andersonii.AAC.1